MKNWASQIVIGIIVTVVGTMLANALVRGHGKFRPGASHIEARAHDRR
jgi:hypothetical protein